MSSGFHRRRGGHLSVVFEPGEAGVLHTLFRELIEMLDDGERHVGDDPLAQAFGSVDERKKPDDPALARLLPDGYSDDDEATQDFRRYTEGDLRAGKANAATVARDSLGDGGKLDLTREQGEAWLRVLNDLRLTLGVRLEVTEDHELAFSRLSDADPRKQAWYIYDWLGFLQQTLVEALMRDL